MIIFKLIRHVLFACISLIGVGCAIGADECGSLQNNYGPYDYWVDKDKLPIVEQYHFTSEIEQLRSGNTGYIGSDIGYTLRAFPNHPRALVALVYLGEKLKTDEPRGVGYKIYCFFERAIRFRPEDATVRMIYGTYLSKINKYHDALEQLEMSLKLKGGNANLHYNLGLVYFELGRYDESLEHAHIAYRLGFGLKGLRAKLERAGHWRDDVAVGSAHESSLTQEGSQ